MVQGPRRRAGLSDRNQPRAAQGGGIVGIPGAAPRAGVRGQDRRAVADVGGYDPRVSAAKREGAGCEAAEGGGLIFFAWVQDWKSWTPDQVRGDGEFSMLYREFLDWVSNLPSARSAKRKGPKP